MCTLLMWLQSEVADGNCLVQSGCRWLSAKVAELGAMLETETESVVAGDFSCSPLVEGCKLAGLAGCAGLVELPGNVEIAMKLWLNSDVVN